MMKRMTNILLDFKQRDLEMKRQDLGAILATQLIECVNNNRYGHMSTVGEKYSHLNDTGKDVMITLIESLVPVAHSILKEEIQTKTEQLMMDNLKK